MSEKWGDDVAGFKTRPAPANHCARRLLDGDDLGQMLFLAQRPNGDCIYLDSLRGCSIYERRPAVCRAFSCVGQLRRAGPDGVVGLLLTGAIDADILDAGLARMERPERRRFMRVIRAEMGT